MDTSKKEYSFTPGAMAIIQMGEEQIGHPSTAINELVKNGYDADADKSIIYINYSEENPQSNFILIYDNGLGMNESILFGKWLQPSMSTKRTEEKKERVSEIYKRKFLGFKGIGRLATMSLGQYLTVISKTSEEGKFNWLNIDREVFKKEVLLSEIKFPGGKADSYQKLFESKELLQSEKVDNRELVSFFNSTLKLDSSKDNKISSNHDLFGQGEGTLIVIQNLDDSINTIFEEQYTHEFDGNSLKDTALYKSLSDLITPLKLNTKVQEDLKRKGIIDSIIRVDNGESLFSIFYGDSFLQNKQKDYSLYEIETEDILDIYDYRVYGKVSSDFNVNAKYHCKRLKEDTYEKDFLLKKGFLLSDEFYNIKVKNDETNSKYEGVDLGAFFFDIRVYDLDGDAKEQRARRLGDIGRRSANSLLKKHLGLKISKNGFGVKPYGIGGNDWLELGGLRVKRHEITIGPNQIIGNIILISPENDSLKEKTNREGFLENKAFTVFKKVLYGILDEAGRRRQKYRLKHAIGRKTKPIQSRPDIEKFLTYVKSQVTNTEFIQYVEKFAEETNTALDNMEGALSFAQRLASLGSGLELVYHELAQPLAALGATYSTLEIYIEQIEGDLKNKMKESLCNYDTSLTLLDELKNSLRPAIGKSLAKNFYPFKTFEKVCTLFKGELNKGLKIELGSSGIKSLSIKSYEYVFWVSFLNIVNNAVYWLQNISYKERFIKIDKFGEIGIIVSNNGLKINEDDLEVIFEYGISGRKEKNATGLGLSFTRNMLNSIGWEIYAKNLSYGAAFIMQKKKINE